MACSAQVVRAHSVHADRKLMHVHLRRSVRVVRLPHHHRRRQARQQAGVVAGGRETGRAPTVNAAAVVRKLPGEGRHPGTGLRHLVQCAFINLGLPACAHRVRRSVSSSTSRKGRVSSQSVHDLTPTQHAAPSNSVSSPPSLLTSTSCSSSEA